MTDEYEWMNARMGPVETGNTITMTGKDLDRVREIARQAGYRAGLEEIKGQMQSNISWHGLRTWIDDKLKEQP